MFINVIIVFTLKPLVITVYSFYSSSRLHALQYIILLRLPINITIFFSFPKTDDLPVRRSTIIYNIYRYEGANRG